jgi:hypothetical protein
MDRGLNRKHGRKPWQIWWFVHAIECLMTNLLVRRKVDVALSRLCHLRPGASSWPLIRLRVDGRAGDVRDEMHQHAPWRSA